MGRRVALIGATGQLAYDLRCAWAEHAPEDQLIGLTHAEVEVADLNSGRAILETIRPTLVVNTSAYHKVDVVEENTDRAVAVNAMGPRNLALACRGLDAVLMHMSTDYVFSGRKAAPYVEADPVDPVNVYGVSKAGGGSILSVICCPSTSSSVVAGPMEWPARPVRAATSWN